MQTSAPTWSSSGSRCQGAAKAAARAIVATKFAGTLFFLYGFEKNERDTISDKELQLFKLLAEALLGLDATALDSALARGELKELGHAQTHD